MPESHEDSVFPHFTLSRDYVAVLSVVVHDACCAEEVDNLPLPPVCCLLYILLLSFIYGRSSAAFLSGVQGRCI